MKDTNNSQSAAATAGKSQADIIFGAELVGVETV